jgi:excisionase family DNA binding protein
MGVTNIESDGLTIAAAAAIIGISKRHLEKLIARGEGPAVIKLGRRSIIRRKTVSRWLAAREAAMGTTNKAA